MYAQVRVAASCFAAVFLLIGCSSDIGGPRAGPDTILIQPSNATLFSGDALRLNVTATGDTPALQASEVVWSSSNPRVAAVSKDGMVMGGAPGTARIEAWWSGTRANATVVVLDGGKRHTKCLASLTLGHPGGHCQAD